MSEKLSDELRSQGETKFTKLLENFGYKHALSESAQLDLVDLAIGLAEEAESRSVPVCEVCGEQHDSEKLLGKVDRCETCYAALEYRSEQLTSIIACWLNSDPSEERDKLMVLACESAGICKAGTVRRTGASSRGYVFDENGNTRSETDEEFRAWMTSEARKKMQERCSHSVSMDSLPAFCAVCGKEMP